MTSEQMIGLLLLAVGSYLFVCATWKRDFLLYRLKVGRVSGLFGERFAHGFYQVLGAALIIAGLLKGTGVWGAPQ
jgi:hypothetical protein